MKARRDHIPASAIALSRGRLSGARPSCTSGSHTVFHHRYHIVWITKYRYKVLDGALRERIRTIFRHMYKENWASRSYPAFCRENMSCLLYTSDAAEEEDS